MAKIGFKIWLLIIAIGLSLLAISPHFEKGVLVTYVQPNSTAYEQGLRTNEIIISINGQIIKNTDAIIVNIRFLK